MKVSVFISILLGFTFAFLIVSGVRGAFNWIMWGSLLLGTTITFIGIKYLTFKKPGGK